MTMIDDHGRRMTDRMTSSERDQSFPDSEPRDAATIMLIDRAGVTPKVLLGRRHAGHKFMPGKFVFPGGRIEALDRTMSAVSELHPDTQAKLLVRVPDPSPAVARGFALAAVRELAEEIGTAHAEIIGEHPAWLTYDLPPELIGKALGGRYRGQRQRWFALRFLGDDAEIRLDLDPHPEFDAWRWADLADLPAMAVPFKRTIYEVLAASFAGIP